MDDDDNCRKRQTPPRMNKTAPPGGSDNIIGVFSFSNNVSLRSL